MDHISITDIRSVALQGDSPKGGWSTEITPESSVHALVAVHTDAGITGFGSVFTNGRLVEAAIEVLRPLWENENALEPERITEKLNQNSFWMGRGGTLTHAISGIDIALWDILGKALGQPVGRLLGGYHTSRVLPYCSILMEQPDLMGAAMQPFLEQGFRAFKIGWGPFGRCDNAGDDEAIVRAAREAIGPDRQLFVDAGASDAFWPNGLKWALNTARMLKDYDVGWFEEALVPDALDDFITLRRESLVPIAGGEVLTRRQSFLPFVSGGAFDIVQPDVTKVGGISEQRRIAWMADDFGVRYVGHGWNTALGLAADLHLAAAIPHVKLVEYIGGSAYVDGILAEPFKLDEAGYLTIPTEPGLGVTLDQEKVAKYASNSRHFFGN